MFNVVYTHVNPKIVKDRIIFNPNYGGQGCSVPGTCMIPIKERKIKPLFFVQLRKSVEAEGFRNPILLYNTPEGLLLSFGGSRLRVAKELDKIIPAIVVDYVGDMTWHVSDVTPENFGRFFTDVPLLFEFTDVGIETHYSLERMRRDKYDPEGMAWTEEGDVDTAFLGEEFPWLDE